MIKIISSLALIRNAIQGCVQVLKSGGHINVFYISKTCGFNFYAQTMPRGFLADTMYVLSKAAGN